MIWAVRGMLVALLVASAASRMHSFQERFDLLDRFDPTATIAGVLRAEQYIVNTNPAPPRTILSWIVPFRPSGCSAESFALAFPIQLEALPMVRRVAQGAYRFRYFYFDSVWEEQKRLAMFAEWVKYAALSSVGLSPYLPVMTGVLLAEPLDCPQQETVDWRRVWARDGWANARTELPVVSTALAPGPEVVK